MAQQSRAEHMCQLSESFEDFPSERAGVLLQTGRGRATEELWVNSTGK